jgi:nicotinate-nucleotide pyrophosphorylase (carboxylating)
MNSIRPLLNLQTPADLLLRPLVESALREDIRSGDITTQALIPADARGVARMNFRESGVVCGLDLARLAWRALDETCELQIGCAEGDFVAAGQCVLEVRGSGAALLSGERVALNFVQRLSGIASLTHQFVQAVEDTRARIVDTRKTTPGLRLLEKYAVRCGGGANHRFALDDMILIKDNHIVLCGGIEAAIERARRGVGHSLKIEVECDTIEQVEEAARAGADIILLDNMSAATMREAVEMIRAAEPKVLCEASGGITLQSVREKAHSGVDLISIGALTHSARALDIGLDIAIH